MPTTDFQLVALDIDGTLLDSAGRISASLKAIVARLAALSVRTVLCTGRRWRTVLPVIEEIAQAHPVAVCCGGALIKEADRHRTLYTDPISNATARRAVQLFRSGGLVPLLLFDRPTDGRELLVSELDRGRAGELPYLKVHRQAVEYYPGEFIELAEQPLEVYAVDDLSRVAPQRQRIGDAFGKEAIVTSLVQRRYGARQVALEVHGPTATKWRALSWLLERWEMHARQVIAIGDDLNDIPMLRAAGLSFAMGNAPPEVKAAADRLTASNDEDGAALALRSVFPDLD